MPRFLEVILVLAIVLIIGGLGAAAALGAIGFVSASAYNNAFTFWADWPPALRTGLAAVWAIFMVALALFVLVNDGDD